MGKSSEKREQRREWRREGEKDREREREKEIEGGVGWWFQSICTFGRNKCIEKYYGCDKFGLLLLGFFMGTNMY